MIEPHDRPTQAQKLSLDARVVCDENTCSIQDTIRRFYERSAKIFDLWLSPEVGQRRVTGVSVSENGPAFVPKTFDDPDHVRKVVSEGRGCFWHTGKLCIPVERNGNRTWITLTPVASVPRVQSWAADDSGRLVRVAALPPPCHFIVGADVPDHIAMLPTT